MKRLLPLLVLGTLFSALFAPAVRADSLQETFARGNRAFAREEYAEAVREYERVVEAGVDDPDVSFNLASAHGALGHYGQAIRYFERSLRLSPGDEVAEKALAQARSALGEREAQRSGEALVASRPPLAMALFARLHVDTLAWLLLASTWIACACALALFRAQLELARLALGISCACAAVLALVSAFGVGTLADWGRSEARAVVIVPAAPLRDGPDPGAQARGELLEGTPARILSHEGAFVRVESGSQVGFVLASEVGEI